MTAISFSAFMLGKKGRKGCALRPCKCQCLGHFLTQTNFAGCFQTEPGVKIKAIRIILNRKKKSKGFAYIDCVTVEDARKVIRILHDRATQDKKLFAAISKPVREKRNDQSTLFLTNLPYEVTEADIKEKVADFKDYIKEIRLVMNDQGQCKGYGYLEVIPPSKVAGKQASKEEESEESESDEELMDDQQKQVKLERLEELLDKIISKFQENAFIRSRKIIVQKSDSLMKLKKKQQLVVYLNGLSFKAKEKDVEDFFKQRELKTEKVLIVRDQNKRSLGYGYAEFKNFQDFEVALKIREGEIKGRKFDIQMSDREITEQKHWYSPLPAQPATTPSARAIPASIR